MRRMRVILGSKVLGLLRRTFAIPSHEFSISERHLYNQSTSIVRGDLDLSQGRL